MDLVIVKVQSSKGPEIMYTVDTEAGTCECPQYQRRLLPQMAHEGDPCQHCGTPHDDVAVGPCPARPKLTCKHISSAMAYLADQEKA